jgi:iron complex outermembrane receptor protein
MTGAAVIVFAGSQASMAQTAPTAAPASSDSSEPVQVVVTGTLIKGLKAPTGSNLETVTSAKIEATGATSSLDLLNQTVPQLPTFNAIPTGSANWGNPVTKLGLRGFGNTTGNAAGQTGTLLLFNGHRVVPVGVISTDPDPEMIPADVLESVQVMPDGGSATYGSDAAGGVINFVAKKKFDGLQLHLQDAMAKDYNESTVSLTTGKSWTGGSVVFSAITDRHGPVLGIDRDYITNNHTAEGGKDFRQTYCPYGVFTVNGTVYTGDTFAAQTAAPRCDQSNYTSIAPDSKRVALFGYFEQKLTESLKFSVDALYSDRQVKIYTDVATMGTSATITSANPYFHSVAGETSQTVTYDYSRAIGPYRITPQEYSDWQVDPELDWRVNDDWDVKADLLYGRSEADVHDRSVINGAAVNAANVDPYDTSQMSQPVIASLTNYELYSRGINTLESGQLVANGSLWNLPGGTVKTAIGYEWRRQELDDLSVTGPIGSMVGAVKADASRKINAGFAELFVPIVGEGNAMPGIKSLSLDLAVRDDDYSDFGSTTNPRIGIDYHPIDDLRIRANYQTTFNAPSLADDGNKIDTRLQVLPLGNGYYKVYIAGAGQNIKPTTGKTFSIGADWKPHQIDGLDISATYWNTSLTNIVAQALSAYGGSVGASRTAYNLCGVGDAAITLTASASGACTASFINSIGTEWNNRLDAGAAPGISSVNDLFSNGNQIAVLIDARRNNFGREKINGIDFNADYHWNTAIGAASVGTSGTYLLQKEIASSATGAYSNFLSNKKVNGATPRLTMAVFAGLTHDWLTVNLTVTHNSGYDLLSGVAPGQTSVGGFTQTDLSFLADIGGHGGLKANVLELSVNNLFDKNPPYYGGSDQTGYANGGTLGRLVRVGIRSKF